MGADELIYYRTKRPRDVDVVLDSLFGDVRTSSLDVLRAGGTPVSIMPGGNEADTKKAAELGVRLEIVVPEADGAGMRVIIELAAQGPRANIDATFPLDEASKAHAHQETGRTMGKNRPRRGLSHLNRIRGSARRRLPRPQAPLRSSVTMVVAVCYPPQCRRYHHELPFVLQPTGRVILDSLHSMGKPTNS